MIMPTKKWEIFPGRNKFFCDGRIMMAPHMGVFCITIFLIVATSILFFVFDCPFLAENVSPIIPAVSGILFLFVMSALLRTSFSDPGVIPRASAQEAALYDKQIEVGNSNSPTYRPPPRTKEVIVKGQPVKLKYCFTCKIFRPPRASHCSLCDNCVDRFDHHCPWVGNCVGRRNYRYFYMFIVSLAFLCVFMFACVVTHLVMVTREVAFIDAVKESPASLLVAVVCFFSVWSVLGLAGFHTYLAGSNQTTNEDIKGSFSSKRGVEGRNPYSEDRACTNCCNVLCGPLPPSLLDRRGIVTQEMLDELKKVKNPNIPTLYGAARTPPQSIGVFPALQDTCGTPNPLQQQCKNGSASHAQSNGKVTPGGQFPVHSNGSTTGSQVRLVPYEQVPLPGGIMSPPSSDDMDPDLSPVIDIDDVLRRSPSLLTLRSLGADGSQLVHENLIMSNIDRTLHGDTSQQLSASRLRLLQESTMIESALDLDTLEEHSAHSGNSSHTGLLKSPYVTPVYH